MTTTKITNVSPLGDLDFPLLGRIVKAGESIDVDSEIAGAAPDPTIEGDIGTGLLAQVSNWAPSTVSKKTTSLADVTPLVTSEGDKS